MDSTLSKNNFKHIPLGVQVFDEEMEQAALNALRHERFVAGEDVFKFEEEFARYNRTKFAVSTSSGTNALQIALVALGVPADCEVITSAYSFVASANVVLQAGASPVFADVDEGDFNISPRDVGRKVTKRTWGLLPVHLYGYPCRMKEICGIAEDHGLKVVEDACQAHGAEYDGGKAGAIGDVGCFSFYPSKNMTVCGDGGMIVTNDEDVAKLAAKLRDCGRKSQYEHDVVGYTSRLNTVNAAIGRVQLRRLEQWNRRRREVASLYDEFLSGIDGLALPPRGDSRVKPAYHLYVVRTKRRDALRDWLQENGVQSGVHYPLPIPLQPIYKQMFGHKAGEYPVSERLSRMCLSLPVHPGLSDDDLRYVCSKIREFFERKTKN